MVDFWNSLTPEEQVALGGLIVALATGFLKKIWPGFAGIDGRVKQVMVVCVGVLVGVVVGELSLAAGISAMAIAAYNLWRTWITEPTANRKMAELIAEDREAGEIE